MLHALLQHRNALHGHVHGHHGQLLGLGQLGIVENLLMYIIDVSEGLLMHFQTLKYLKNSRLMILNPTRTPTTRTTTTTTTTTTKPFLEPIFYRLKIEARS